MIFKLEDGGDCRLTDEEAGQLLGHMRPVIAKNDDTYELVNRLEATLGTDDEVVFDAAMVVHIQSALHDLVGESGSDELPLGLQCLYRALL